MDAGLIIFYKMKSCLRSQLEVVVFPPPSLLSEETEHVNKEKAADALH